MNIINSQLWRLGRQEVFYFLDNGDYWEWGKAHISPPPWFMWRASPAANAPTRDVVREDLTRRFLGQRVILADQDWPPRQALSPATSFGAAR